MHFRKFDLNLLVVLDALLTERNVTRAAEQLFVTQPAVSNALTRIREYFDDQILVRHGREMELTPLARSLVAPVRELILNAGVLLDGDYLFDPAKASRSFRIAMSDYCATVLMAPLMRIISREAPGIRCEVTTLSERSISMLVAGELDMCLTAQDLRMLDAAVEADQFGKLLLFTDDFVCAVDAQHEGIGAALDLSTFLAMPHAVTRFGSGTISMEERTWQRLGLDVKVAAVAPTFGSLISLLEGTPLIISLQRRLAERLAAAFSIRMLTPPIDIPSLEQTLYWHSRSEHDKAHFWMRGVLNRAAATLEPREIASEPASI